MFVEVAEMGTLEGDQSGYEMMCGDEKVQAKEDYQVDRMTRKDEVDVLHHQHSKMVFSKEH